MDSEARPPRRDRYEATGNVEAQYIDQAQTILVNKRGITDLLTLERLEEEGLLRAYELLLAQVRTDTPMSAELIRYIHKQAFEELFEWGGRWRTVSISKPGALWPPPTYLDRAMIDFERDVLNQYPAAALRDDEVFCRAAGVIQGEFLAIHPFREGNARTIKLLVDLLATQTGRHLLVYDPSEAGRLNYIEAARAALLKKDYQPMADIIRRALASSRIEE